MRVIILAILVFLVYHTLRRWLTGGPAPPPGGGNLTVDDDMLRDPHCGVYVARHDGVHVRLDGRDLHFCSPACRDAYLAEHDRPHESD